jgi:carbamoyl-phosphate synthase large subunit
MPKPNILISSAGRRVGLLACVHESVVHSGRTAEIFTIDCGSSAPATFVSDRTFRVHRCTDADFIDQVFRLCEEQNIGLVIPTIDTELPVYATNAERLSEAGVTVCISSPETIRICNNKISTHRWFVDNGFPTVRQTDVASAMSCQQDWPLPLIAKPYDGSASLGIRRIETHLDLEAAAESGPQFIVQEIAAGMEFTINVYVGRPGKCLCAVPHWRMEVRAGEVSKGLTFKDARLMQLARTVAETLPGAYGPLNIQGFLDASGTIKLIEVNARFGGGYPLAHRAGARFTDWLLDELDGKSVPYTEDWIDDLAMLRYDDAVFTSGSLIRA